MYTKTPAPMRDMRAALVTALSAIIAIVSALQMRDHVRLVEISGLFASGAGPAQASQRSPLTGSAGANLNGRADG